MRKFKEVLRLKFGCGLSNRKIAKSCSTTHVTVAKYLMLAEEAGLTWPLDEGLDDATLEKMLYAQAERQSSGKAHMPPMDYLYKELKRKGVTLQLLWYEYKQDNPDGYQYSYFCELYSQWVKKLDLCLRQEHRAGEKLFVDYAGQTVPIVNPQTGDIACEAQLFVATLGASNYTYCEATVAQSLRCWIKSHIRAFEFFGGTTQILVPDNLKSGITHPCRYEPDVNPTYQDLANHYGTTVIPARPGAPRDKAKVESAVLVAERWILAALRNHTFFSLQELNQEIAKKLEVFNTRKLQKLESSRKDLFESVDRPALLPLPARRYEYAEWKKARVNIDYHIEYDHHYYSVPYQLRKEQVDLRITDTTLEVLFKGKRVASYQRSYEKGRFTTIAEHMPKCHREYLEWTPSRIIGWAAKTGPATKQLVEEIINRRPHPEQAFRACLGVIRLGKRYSPERLEKACNRALSIGSYSYKSVDSILKKGLDSQPLSHGRCPSSTTQHANIRGNNYFKEDLP